MGTTWHIQESGGTAVADPSQTEFRIGTGGQVSGSTGWVYKSFQLPPGPHALRWTFARDPYTWGHSERVARMAVRLAHEMGLSESDISDLYLGGLLHDIGKIGVRDDVLRKPGPLTEEERAMIEKHTVIGDAILSHVGQLTHLRPIVRNHHERWDGRGYPDRLRGEHIPLAARILAVADGCDAMLSDRPYRKGMAPERIDQIVREGAGSHWDPDVVAMFFACRDDIYSVHQQGVGDSVARALDQVLNGTDPIGTTTSLSEFSLGTSDT